MILPERVSAVFCACPHFPPHPYRCVGFPPLLCGTVSSFASRPRPPYPFIDRCTLVADSNQA